MSQQPKATREHARLEEIRSKQVPWRKWGPYLSERQWGGVRENLNKDVEAWNDVTHDQSRSRAYLSGEDGIAGFCDDKMLLCLSLALWNGKDPILKERMFGLTNSEGNHGEDVKEYYFYLDSTPTHSYMKMLYKYPQAEYPYGDLVAENRRRSKTDFEYELLDTGIFNEDRYWDVFVEFAKSDAEDVSLKITAFNRGPEAATLHILPHLWFRNTWWVDEQAPRPELTARDHHKGSVIAAKHPALGQRFLYCDGPVDLLFTDNETNRYRLWGQPNPTQFQKDGINDYVVQERKDAVNPAKKGTKAAAHTVVTVRARPERHGSPAPLRPAARRSRRSVRPFRSDVRRPQAGGGRVLHGDHPAFAERRRGERHPPGVWRAALVEAGLRLRRGAMAEGARHPARLGHQHPQPALVPHVQRRHHLDARQVGVPLVRRLGSGLSLDVVGVRRSRVRRRSAGAHAARTVPAPERPAPGLRVELRRRQSTRPCLGGALQLSPQPRKPRRPGDPVLEAHLQQLAGEPHLVAQPQGPRRPQPLRGRLSGPRQHRGLRSQLAAADRRLHRAGRRHGLDGVLFPEHARPRARDRARRPDVRGHGDQVLRARDVDRRGLQSNGRARFDVGRGGRVLSTTCSACPDSSTRGSR